MFQTLEPFTLASASPRRRRLLQSLGLDFDVVVSGVEETQLDQGSPRDLVCGWAAQKAVAVSRAHPDQWLLAADTTVVVAGEILGKPSDPEDARRMLERLSDREHQVITAVCLCHAQRCYQELHAVTTQVRFKHLEAAVINAYVASGEPFDKAGAYGIQGRGACPVHSICGSYTNVVGLPLAETVDCLMARGIIAPRGQPGGRTIDAIGHC